MAGESIADAEFFPCPACGANPGELCTEFPGLYATQRAEGDAPWCHTLRKQVMVYNARLDGFELVIQ